MTDNKEYWYIIYITIVFPPTEQKSNTMSLRVQYLVLCFLFST
jgi:hypothetical protein